MQKLNKYIHFNKIIEPRSISGNTANMGYVGVSRSKLMKGFFQKFYSIIFFSHFVVVMGTME